MPPRLAALLATMRVANLPSVVSNVWLGVALGVFQWGQWPGLATDAVRLGLAGVLLCLAGNFLNDWHDRDWDARRRPERGLPRRLFPSALYLQIAVGCAVAGLLLAAWTGGKCLVVAALICACIAVYTKWHKHAIWSVVPLAMCRALLPVMAMPLWPAFEESSAPAGVYFFDERCLFHMRADLWQHLHSWSFLLTHASGPFCWTAGLSLVARYESMESPPAGSVMVGKALLFLPLLTM